MVNIYFGDSTVLGKTFQPAYKTFMEVNQTPRIPGNQAWYHRSAGVKTTGKILNKKIKKRLKMVKMVKIAKNCQNCQKRSKSPKMVKIAKNCQNGLKSSEMVPNGLKWSKMV